MAQTSMQFSDFKSLNSFTFPAIRGVQAGREFYIVMAQLRQIPRIFMFDEQEVPPELRAQRVLNKARIPKIVSYVLNNKDNYVFSALTASIDGEPIFHPLGENSPIGNLEVPMDATLLINDGQHRRAAIEQAIAEAPELGYESIPVVFFVDVGLKQSQQMFADLNKHSVRPTQSLSILYDHRDVLSRKVLRLAETVDLFKGRIEKEKSSISNRSRKLFTLSALYNANKHIFSDVKTSSPQQIEKDFNFAKEYWNFLSEIIKPWVLVKEDKLSAYEFRKEFTVGHAVLLETLGMVGGQFKELRNWKEKIRPLEKIDWSRSNPQWDGLAVEKGRMVKKPSNVIGTFDFLMEWVEKGGE